MLVSRDVVFDEHHFPFATPTAKDHSIHPPTFHHSDRLIDEDRDRETQPQQPTNTLVSPAQSQPSSEEHDMRGPTQQQLSSLAGGAPSVPRPEDRGSIHLSPASSKPASTVDRGSYGPSNDRPQPSAEDPESSSLTQASSSSPPDMGTNPLVVVGPERERRVRKLPSHLHDYICFSARPHDPSYQLTAPHSSPQVSSGKPYPLANYITCDKFSVSHRSYLAAISKIEEPRFFHEAVTNPLWKDAMIKEIEALEKNHTWSIVDLPAGKKAH